MRGSTTGTLLLAALFQSASVAAHSSCPHRELGQHFDYVIVGGGTAGLVLANRLSEESNVTVAVVEAGTFPEDVHGNWTQVPFYDSKFYNISDPMMWNLSTTPQTEMFNVSFDYYRAKSLGGCSDVNTMAYGHTCIGAHQLWADMVDDQSYTYDNMLQFYHRTMNFTPPNSLDRGANATPMYNPNDTVTGGGLAVTYSNYAQPWATWLARGIEAIGIPRVDSFINGNLFGQAFNMDTINQTDGFRSSSQAAYLRPVLSRPNLAVFDLTMAERVIFNHQKEATGVLIAKDCILTANKEVILSAGLFKSPQMLMVSGVGPAALLKSLNIPVVADRPGVGQNMKDHLATFVTYQVNLLTGSELDVSASYLEDSINKFNVNATGPLASPGGDSFAMEVIPEDLRGNWSAGTNESLAQLPADWPHIGYAAFPSIGRGTPSIPIDATGNYASSLAIMIAPQSTENVSISSANITDPPIINPMYFTNLADLDILVAAIKRLRQAFKSSALAPILIGPEVLPGEDVQTDEEIVTYLRKTSYSMAHGFSTNKMGTADDPLAVIDSHGRVYGVQNLRVVDCSAFPFLPPGYAPQIQVYTLAEKMAQDIKDTVY